MRIARTLIVAAIVIVIVQSAVTTAFAWYWPIVGFGDTCQGYHQQGNIPLPGTPQWPYYPGSGRGELVVPGVAYCPVHGRLNFGFAPGCLDTGSGPVGVHGIGLLAGPAQPAAVEKSNETLESA